MYVPRLRVFLLSSSFVPLSIAISFNAHAQAQSPVQTQPAVRGATSKAAAKPVSAADGAQQVLVTAQRDSTEKALADQLHAVGVSSILSREQIERAPETNLSDILTRLPGLSTYSNMNQGQAATGENQYVTIRGLDASYNSYSLNGERIAPADPTTRAISFDMLAPYGITQIDVSKTTTADMDGDATGGAIDIRTPTAYDFAGSYNRITIQGQLNDKAAGIGTSDLGGNVEVESARKFGHDDRFGVYVAGYYLEKNVAADAVSPNSAYEPTFASQANLPLGDASQLSTPQLKYDIYTTNIQRYGGILSLDYHGDHQTVYLRSTYGAYNTTENDNQVSIRGSNLVYNAAGVAQSNTVERGQYFETDDAAQSLTTQKLGGTTDLGPLGLAYDLFNSYGVQASPNQFEASLYPATMIQGPVTFDVAGTTLPRVVGATATLAAVNNQDLDKFWKTQGRDSSSTADTYGIHADATYRFRISILDDVRFGFKISDTDRQSWQRPYFHDDNNFIFDGPFFGGPNYAADAAAGPPVGVLPGQEVNSFGGAAGPVRLLNRNWIGEQILPYKYQNDPNGTGIYTQTDYNANTARGSETIYAGYVMFDMHVGQIHIYPGFRYEWTNFTGQHWVANGDDATGQFARTSQMYGEPLPVINIDWRPTDESVLRFSARRSFSRPAYGLINGATSITLDPLTNQIMSVSEPNPNIRPSTATDLDASAELYNHNGGVVSASAYYKIIDKFIFTSVSGTTNSSTLGGNVPSNAFEANGTLFSMPENGKGATLAGLELNTEQRLSFLPGLFSGFGFNGNVTLQQSSAQSGITGHPATDLPRAPELIYNIGIFYAKHNFRADLNYNYIGEQLLSLNSSGPDFYLQPTTRLDLTMQYRFPRGLVASIAMQNLLDGPAYWETEGKGRSFLAYDSNANGSYVQTGRVFLAGASVQF